MTERTWGAIIGVVVGGGLGFLFRVWVMRDKTWEALNFAMGWTISGITSAVIFIL